MLDDTHGDKSMADISKNTVDFHQDEGGATATEYVAITALVACFIVAGVALFGEQLQRPYQEAVAMVHCISPLHPTISVPGEYDPEKHRLAVADLCPTGKEVAGLDEN